MKNSKIKEIVHYICALILLFSGIVMCFLCFYENPRGEISEGVLMYFGQCLIFSGSVFSLTLYVKQQVLKYSNRNENK